jgi:hypothetical protein
VSKALRPAALLAAVTLLITPALASAKPSLHGRIGGASHAQSGRDTVRHGGLIHGVVLNAPGQDPNKTIATLERLRADGVNLVSIYITWEILNKFSSDLHRRSDTPSDRSLASVTALAHRLGFAVEWMPIVTTSKSAPRYEIEPNNMAEWWSAYTSMIDHYGKLAGKEKVDLFSIGSEYAALQKYKSNWLTIISHLRHQDGYHGLTTYMSTTGAGFPDLDWWGNVDLLSVSPYWSLSPARIPDVKQLVRAWRNQYLPVLKTLYNTYHKPVLMDEIGYPNQDYSAYHPAVAWQNHSAAPNEQAQANAYEALLQVSSLPVYRSWMRGVVWFYWGGTHYNRHDTSYSPQGKMAECVLAKYWAARSAPGCLATHLP